jgi:hypothetical protein
MNHRMKHHRRRSRLSVVENWIWLGSGLVWEQVGRVLLLLEEVWEGRNGRVVWLLASKLVLVT